MNIKLEDALMIARHQKEIGCCSANAQAIVLLYDEVERLKETLEKLKFNVRKSDD